MDQGVNVLHRPAWALWLLCVPILCGDTSVHQEIAAGDEGAFRSHQQGRYCTYLVGSTTTLGCAGFNHAPVTLATRP